MNHYLIEKMHIDGDVARVRYGDLDWNGFLLDLIDWNELASKEADSILKEAFGSLPDDDTLRCYFDTYWSDVVQRAWLEIPGDTLIEVPVVLDSDGGIDEYETEDKLHDAIAEYATENTHLTYEQRENEVVSLRMAHPDFVGKDFNA